MNTYLIALLLTYSTLGFSNTSNDFKKGYEAGRRSIQSNAIHTCEVNFEYIGKHYININDKANGEGLSRGLALMSLIEDCSNKGQYYGAPECLERVRNEESKCKEI
ncbi:MAG: hypothetical protein AB8E15_11140 [Bdellovibrionales bacterium]